MDFHEALRIQKGVTAIVGGGGKTGLMLALGRELAALGSVALCTTTRIYPPQGVFTLTGADDAAARAALAERGLVCFGEEAGQKLRCPGLGVEALAGMADYVIAEADGSAGLPLKAHAPHEPVIPAGADVVYVVGAAGMGRPIAEAAHRPELYARALGCGLDHHVTPADAASMVDRGCKALFNQADIPGGVELGREFAAHFDGVTVIASLRQGRVIEVLGRLP